MEVEVVYCSNGVKCVNYSVREEGGVRAPGIAAEGGYLCLECNTQGRRRQPPPEPKENQIGRVPVYAKGETLRRLITGEEIVLRSDGSPAGIMGCSPYSLRPATK